MTATRKLFGTDGIRAIAGEAPLDPITVFATGLALGHSLKNMAAKPSVILGRDTRESSPWIAATLAAGLRAVGSKRRERRRRPHPRRRLSRPHPRLSGRRRHLRLPQSLAG